MEFKTKKERDAYDAGKKDGIKTACAVDCPGLLSHDEMYLKMEKRVEELVGIAHASDSGNLTPMVASLHKRVEELSESVEEIEGGMVYTDTQVWLAVKDIEKRVEELSDRFEEHHHKTPRSHTTEYPVYPPDKVYRDMKPEQKMAFPEFQPDPEWKKVDTFELLKSATISNLGRLFDRVEAIEDADCDNRIWLAINDINAMLTLAGIKNDEGGQLIADLIDAVDELPQDMIQSLHEWRVTINKKAYRKVIDALSAVKNGKPKSDTLDAAMAKIAEGLYPDKAQLVADLVRAAEAIVITEFSLLRTPSFQKLELIHTLKSALSALKGEL